MNKCWIFGPSSSSLSPVFSGEHIIFPFCPLYKKTTVSRSRCLCCRQGGSPQSGDISVLPWIWFNGMTHLIQVTDSSKGDDSNEEYIRPQSYFYRDKSWQEEMDKRETDETCMCAGMCVLTHVQHQSGSVYYCNHQHIAATRRKHTVFVNSIQQPEIWSVY